jgi:hypothetical protein
MVSRKEKQQREEQKKKQTQRHDASIRKQSRFDSHQNKTMCGGKKGHSEEEKKKQSLARETLREIYDKKGLEWVERKTYCADEKNPHEGEVITPLYIWNVFNYLEKTTIRKNVKLKNKKRTEEISKNSLKYLSEMVSGDEDLLAELEKQKARRLRSDLGSSDPPRN